MKKKQNLQNNSQSPNLEKEKINSKRSEEISDIIERMPMKFGRWIIAVFLLFIVFLFFFGWIIKYPETITGHIKINSTNAPVKLVSNTSGNIREIAFEPQKDVKKGDYIAVIENSAITEDIRKVIELITSFNPNEKHLLKKINHFPEKISLGDLDLKYYAFLTALKNKANYEEDNIYEKQKNSLLDDIQWRATLLEEVEKSLSISKEKMDISRKWLKKYSSLNQDEIITYEYEVDKSKTDFLYARQEEQNLKKEIVSIKMQITENKNKLNQLAIEQREKEKQLQLDLLTTYHDLNDNLKSWEQKYIFKAPFDGKIEFMKFLSENQFIQVGEEVFGVVPENSTIFGQVLLPTGGAGKVKTGSRVIVKLDNYPYMEYGSIDGIVASISLLSQPQSTGQTKIETYLLIVKLPNQLKTNYGETLSFQHEIGGSADIIIKERRLIERLFENLKYRIRDK